MYTSILQIVLNCIVDVPAVLLIVFLFKSVQTCYVTDGSVGRFRDSIRDVRLNSNNRINFEHKLFDEDVERSTNRVRMDKSVKTDRREYHDQIESIL